MAHVSLAVSGARNPTHGLYVFGYVRSLAASGVVSVNIDDCDASGVFETDTLRSLTGGLPLAVTFDSLPVADIDTYVAIGRVGLRTWASIRRVRSVRCVVVDEGLGGYGSSYSAFTAMRREGSGWVSGVRRSVGVAISGAIPHVDWRLFRTVGRRWEARDDVAAELRGLAAAGVESAVAGGPRAVYFSQPWPELGLMAENQHIAKLQAIKDIAKGAGYELSIRPHPLEPRYRFADADWERGIDGPAELDPLLSGFDVFIGETSSALLNLSVLRSKVGIRVTFPDLVSSTLPLSSGQRRLLDTFLDQAESPERLSEALKRHLVTPPPS